MYARRYLLSHINYSVTKPFIRGGIDTRDADLSSTGLFVRGSRSCGGKTVWRRMERVGDGVDGEGWSEALRILTVN